MKLRSLIAPLAWGCVLGAAVVIFSCNSSSGAALSATCSINSDCNSPLVCAFARCHAQCIESRDCTTPGERCVSSGTGTARVCQLPPETACATGATCSSTQVCSPTDQQCRQPCQTNADCAGGQFCAMSGAALVCLQASTPADEPALMTAGILSADGSVLVDASGSDGASDGSPAAASDAGARCASPPCSLGQLCRNSTDCSPNLQCIGGKCLQCVPGTTTCPGTAEVTCQNGLLIPSGSDCASGCDPGTNRCRVCPASTCSTVKVIFHGLIGGADGGPQDVQLAVDVSGKVQRSASASDPTVGHDNVLVGNFITDADGGLHSPVQYATDNNACGLATYGARVNAYYLAQMKGLPVDPSFYQPQCTCGGQCGAAPCGDSGPPTCDFENVLQGIACPNFGTTCNMTPRKIQAIETAATSGDLSCKICLYSSTTPSATTLLKCLSPNTTLSAADLYAAGDAAPVGFPVLLRLDDGSSCGSY